MQITYLTTGQQYPPRKIFWQEEKSNFLELATGIEPVTSPLPRECSTTELREQAPAIFFIDRTIFGQKKAEIVYI